MCFFFIYLFFIEHCAYWGGVGFLWNEIKNEITFTDQRSTVFRKCSNLTHPETVHHNSVILLTTNNLDEWTRLNTKKVYIKSNQIKKTFFHFSIPTSVQFNPQSKLSHIHVGSHSKSISSSLLLLQIILFIFSFYFSISKTFVVFLFLPFASRRIATTTRDYVTSSFIFFLRRFGLISSTILFIINCFSFCAENFRRTADINGEYQL